MVLASIVILNYNGKHFLRKCFDALLRQTLQDYEIIFVDNASTDGSAEFVERRYAPRMAANRLLVIRNKKNLGFAEGNNVGHRVAKGKYVVLLNNDTEVSPQWLEEMVVGMRLKSWQGKPVMMVGGLWGNRGLRTKMRDIIKRQKRTTTLNLCGEIVYVPQRPSATKRENAKTKESAEKAAGRYADRYITCFSAPGLSAMYRRKDFRTPYDGDYFANAEDVAQSWVSRLRGGNVVMALDAWVAHYGGGTQRDMKAINKLAVFHGTKNQIINYITFYEKKNLLRIAPLMIITQLAHLVQNPRKIVVKPKAYWWILRNIGHIIRKRKAVQSQRKVPDSDIVQEMSCAFYDLDTFELYDNSTRGGEKNKRRFGIALATIKIANALFYAYCWIVRLKTREFNR